MNKEEIIGKLQMVYVGDKNALNELIGYYDGLKQGIEELQQENKKYKEVIDKAKEYIENNPLYEEEYDYDYEENSYLSGIDDETAKKDLLKILRGEING